MKPHVFSLILSLLVLSIAGCEKKATAPASQSATIETTQSVATATTASAVTDEVTPLTGQDWIEDVTVEMGTEARPDGKLVVGTASDDYKAGQPVIVSMHVASVPANTTVKVVWIGPNGARLGEETKTTAPGQKYLTFISTDTKSWAKGDYKAEYWFGDKKVSVDEFKIV